MEFAPLNSHTIHSLTNRRRVNNLSVGVMLQYGALPTNYPDPDCLSYWPMQGLIDGQTTGPVITDPVIITDLW